MRLFNRRTPIVLLAILGATSVPLGHELFKRTRPAPPSSPADFLKLLQGCGLENYRVQFEEITTNAPEGGMYLIAPDVTTDPRGLLRATEKASQWSGILFIKPLGRMTEEEIQLNLDAWGEYGLCWGKFLFFGDPLLLRLVIDPVARNRE
jgi:hypothetical protein